MSKEKLLTLSFQDAEIQRMVEERIAADEALTRAAAIRGIFTDLTEAAKEIEFLRANADLAKANQEATEQSLSEVVKENERLTKELIVNEEATSQLGKKMDIVRQQRDAYKATSLFEGLPDEAVEYMQAFFDELVSEGHYPTPQMFFLDLLRRVQEGSKFFIPNNKQIVQKEWIHH